MRWLLPATVTLLGVVSANAQLGFVTDIPGTFVDIAETGTDLMIDDEGEAAFVSSIGNRVIPSGRVVVGNNGAIGFEPPSDNLGPSNGAIPNDEVFGGAQALLPLWDDIGNDIGRVSWMEMDNRTIVQWTGRPVNGSFVTFQLQIFDASEATNPLAQFLYQEVDGAGGGNTATIGYQDGGAGFNDVTFSLNQTSVANGTVLTLVPEPGSAALLASCLLLLRRRSAY